MAATRALLRHPLLAALLLLGALLTRVAVPAGFMPVASAMGVILQLCPDAAPLPEPLAGMHHMGSSHPGMDHGKPDAPAKAEQPCAFSGFAAPALGSADPGLIAAALAFAFLLAITGAAFVLRRAPARLRPPLRAPPLPA